ncbi:MAG: hypothetical protein EPN23_11345 [Verrucomicrobia bacterium]|nr:MAG: hypothetical protein EPN23_11345 [Verrucomicrobiota bacterium]
MFKSFQSMSLLRAPLFSNTAAKARKTALRLDDAGGSASQPADGGINRRQNKALPHKTGIGAQIGKKPAPV